MPNTFLNTRADAQQQKQGLVFIIVFGRITLHMYVAQKNNPRPITYEMILAIVSVVVLFIFVALFSACVHAAGFFLVVRCFSFFLC